VDIWDASTGMNKLNTTMEITASQGIELIEDQSLQEKGKLLLHDGHIFIYRSGNIYTIQGQRLQ
jgi:hypothetical protein